jgi:phosphohistidine phosphatase
VKPLLRGREAPGHATTEWRILVSPSKRTLQTVKALDLPFDVRESLAPSGTPQELLREVGWPADGGCVLVVGHQPTLGQVAARLLGVASGELSIRKGALWWFATRERDGGEETLVRAVINPDLLED